MKIGQFCEVKEEGLERLAQAACEDPLKLSGVADLARRLGFPESAYRLALQARAMAPGDREVLSASARALSGSVPDWHYAIIRDQLRNDSWEMALSKAVAPGSLVLDIGAGTGLLAMMAARAGAGEVVSCEMNPAVADAARDVVRQNGFSDRVRIVSCHSSELDLEKLCGRRADVVVSEIVSNDLVGEDAVDVMTDAVRRLIAPQARIIPLGGEVRVALATWRGASSNPIDSISGFDLTAFERLRRRPTQVKVGDQRLVLSSEAATLIRIDLSEADRAPGAKGFCELRLEGDNANGVIQWISIRLDAELNYENSPSAGASSAWAALFYPFDSSFTTRPGEAVRVHGIARATHLDIWAEPAS